MCAPHLWWGARLPSSGQAYGRVYRGVLDPSVVYVVQGIRGDRDRRQKFRHLPRGLPKKGNNKEYTDLPLGGGTQDTDFNKGFTKGNFIYFSYMFYIFLFFSECPKIAFRLCLGRRFLEKMNVFFTTKNLQLVYPPPLAGPI